MKVRVGEKQFSIKLADTEARRKKGLSGLKSLPKGNGLMLKYEEPVGVTITMEKMKFPLDLIFILDNKVQKVLRGEPGFKEPIYIGQNSCCVLEVNAGEGDGIRMGDEVAEIGEKQAGGKIDYVEGDVPKVDGALHVLNEDGQIQANIKGNERVFSRAHTAQLYKLSKQASETKSEADYKKVGRAVVRMINQQDSQEPEYVEE